MTKLILYVQNSTGNVAKAEYELPVDVPTEHLENVAQEIAGGMAKGWDEMSKLMAMSPEEVMDSVQLPARKKSAMRR